MNKEQRKERDQNLENSRRVAERRYGVLIATLKDYNVTAGALEKCSSVIQMRIFALAGKVKDAIILNKEPLIENLLLIKEGKNTPYATSTKGRTCKVIETFEGQIEAFKAKIVDYNNENKIDFDAKYKPMINQMQQSNYLREMDIISDATALTDFSMSNAMLQKALGMQYVCRGVVELSVGGDGFLRGESYYQNDEDIYVPKSTIDNCKLRSGDFVVAKNADKPIVKLLPEDIHTISGLSQDLSFRRPNFDELSPIYPNEKIALETEREEGLTLRSIDLMCPIGKGQRAVIIAPPKSGKTTLIKKIARAIYEKYSEIVTFVLLIDESPEEVTDIKRNVFGTEVVDSTFDMSAKMQINKAELLLARAKRIVETGKDVVILLDSITKLARAYGNDESKEGRCFGEISYTAMQKAKRFFASARKIDGKGSLTIVATAQVETGVKTDETIFEEFNGVGNCEIYLNGKLSEKKIFPNIVFSKSMTKMDELIQTEKEHDAMNKIREEISSKNALEGSLYVINLLEKTQNNEELVDKLV